MKITETLNARIQVILGNYFDHDTDIMADCTLDLESLILSEKNDLMKKVEKLILEAYDSEHYGSKDLYEIILYKLSQLEEVKE